MKDVEQELFDILKFEMVKEFMYEQEGKCPTDEEVNKVLKIDVSPFDAMIIHDIKKEYEKL